MHIAANEGPVLYRILGPVRAESSGQEAVLVRSRLRGLLGFLLLNANRWVAIDALTEALWGGAPPPSARQQVHTTVNRLRRELRRIGGEAAVDRQGASYRVRADHGTLDLLSFRRAVSDARDAVRHQKPQSAVDLLRSAIGMWTGPGLADAAGTYVDATRARLDDERLAAVEELLEAELAAGRTGGVITEFGPLVEAYPYRERLRGGLMLALYRDGRQVEALDTARRYRRLLADEHGLDPGGELQDLEQAILRADPQLDLAAPAPLLESRPGPAQLPHTVTAFVGRRTALARLDATLAAPAPSPIRIICGPAGVGKTTLAVHWAGTVAERFPDGCLFADLRGFGPHGVPANPTQALHQFLDGLGVPGGDRPADGSALSAAYRSAVAGRRLLIVLDNARDAAQVRPLLPGTPTCHVLVTSREPLSGLIAKEGAVGLRLELMSDEEARDLLIQRLGEERVGAEPDAVDEIIDLCARVPLALAVAAAHAHRNADFPLAALAGEVRSARLDVLTGGDPITDVRTVLSWSYLGLTEAQARLFRLHALHPGTEWGGPAAAALAGQPLAEIRPVLARLCGAQLIHEVGPGRFTSHDLLRAYAAELAESDSERIAATERVLDHYLHTAYAAARILSPHRDDPFTVPAHREGADAVAIADAAAAEQWFTAERGALVAAVDLAERTGRSDRAWQTAWCISEHLDRHGLWHDWIATQKAALRAARRSRDRLGQAVSSRSLALALIRSGRADAALPHLSRALAIYRTLADRPRQAWTHLTFGTAYEASSQFRQALRHNRRALHLFRDPSSPDPSGQARALNAIGWEHALLGQHSLALQQCRTALDILQRIGDRNNQAATLDSMGFAHHHLAHYDDAVECYQRAIAIYDEIGSAYFQSVVLCHLADTHDDAGVPDAARGARKQALAILDGLGHRDAQAVRRRLERGSDG